MVHTFDCPSCNLPLTADEQYVDTRVKCPHCSSEFTAPQQAAAQPAVATSAAPIVDDALLRFTFTCQRCGSALEGHAALCRQLGRCPTCGAVFTVPDVDRRTGLPLGPAEVADDGQLPTPMHAYAANGEKAPSIRRRQNGDPYIVCPRCDFEADVDANICMRCGLPFTIDGASAVSVGNPAATDQLAATSLIVGILGMATFCLPILGAIAIMTGATALLRRANPCRTKTARTQALVGVLCGVVSVIAWLLVSFR